MNAIERCNSCKWFANTEGSVELEGKRVLIGQCRRHAPLVHVNQHGAVLTHWPDVWGNEGCGDHQR